MKSFFAISLFAGLAILVGCNQGTSGGPGASNPPSKTPMVGQAEDTFSLAMPSTKLKQGENQVITVAISRGKNFSEDVSLKISDLPTGVTLLPAIPVIKHGDTDAKITLKAAGDAALGDFTAKVTGHPTNGADAVTDIKISVAKPDPTDVANAAADAAKGDEYTAMQSKLDHFNAQFADMKDRAAKSAGQVKTELDAKLAEARIKLDAAAVKLTELQSAGADSWEKVKEGVGDVFEDLSKIFA